MNEQIALTLIQEASAHLLPLDEVIACRGTMRCIECHHALRLFEFTRDLPRRKIASAPWGEVQQRRQEQPRQLSP